MADEITFGYKSGLTLTYGVFQPDGTVRTSAGTSLPEESGTGYYHATDGNITAGDLVIIKESTNVVGFGEYRSEVDCVLIEGSDFTDILIGADGDTLQSLSDQMDTLGVAVVKVHTIFGPGE